MAQSGPELGDSACLLCPQFSDVDPLGYGKRTVHLDP